MRTIITKQFFIAISFMLLVTACNSSKKKNSKTIANGNKVVLDFKSKTPLVANNTTATVIIYGHDLQLADAKATAIATKEIKWQKTPFRVIFELPETASSLIVPKLSAPENASFYVSFYCDDNNNGLTDAGDIKMDFETGATQKIDITTDAPQEFFIKMY